MGNLPEKPLHQALRLIAIGALALFAGGWAHAHFSTLRIDPDHNSEADLTAAQKRAQPLLDALEKYRADNGLYPTSLQQLTPGYLATREDLPSYRYSARHDDWIFQSDACLDRKQNGDDNDPGQPILQPAKHTANADSHQRDCLSGYREYQLQSADFPVAVAFRYQERWAYYDSQPQYWTVGWCELVIAKETSRELATNGVCRERKPSTIK